MDKDLQLAMAAYQSMYEQPDETEEVEEEETEELQEGPLQDLGTTIKYVAGGGAAGAEQQRNRDLATAKRLGDIRAGRTPAGGMRSGDLSTLRGALNNSYEPEGDNINEITRSMGRRATQYRKDQEQAAHMERLRKHDDKMKNDPEYRERHERLRQTHSRREDQKESFDLDESKKENKQKKNEAVSKIIQKNLHPSVLPSLAYGRRELKKESFDIFDTILEYLISEGYADTNESALAIMSSMSQEWIGSIVEAFVDPEHGEAPSGRSPLENVSDHPKASVRKKAVKGFKKQMGKEYGGKWKSRTDDPTG